MHLRRRLAAVALSLLAGYGLWLGVIRNLPLFQVQRVTVTGLSGGSAPAIRSALELTARQMTTTNVSVAQLRAAISGYTAVTGLLVRTQFPHGLTIAVSQSTPLARLDVDGRIVAVSRGGRVLEGLTPSRGLPLVHSARAPLAGAVADPVTREELTLLAAAPAALRARVYSVRLGRPGLIARMRRGPLIYFGGAALPHAKWDSAAAVLASSTSRGASYIDVSLPGRPAAQVNDPLTSAANGAAGASGTVGALSARSQTGGSSSTSG